MLFFISCSPLIYTGTDIGRGKISSQNKHTLLSAGLAGARRSRVSTSQTIIKTALPVQWCMSSSSTGVGITRRGDCDSGLNYPSVHVWDWEKTRLPFLPTLSFYFLVPYSGNQTAWSRKTPSLLISSTRWTLLTWCWLHYIVIGDEPTVVLYYTSFIRNGLKEQFTKIWCLNSYLFKIISEPELLLGMWSWQ